MRSRIAGPENVKRVAAQLAAAGWPLAGIDTDGIWTDEEHAVDHR
jgi:hypothetical protein